MTPLDFLVIVLSALTLHRIWNYEAITASIRAWFDKYKKINKPFLCPACNAFWWGLAAVLIWKFAPFPVSAALAAFMPMRVAVWCYAKLSPPAPAQQPQAKPMPASAKAALDQARAQAQAAKPNLPAPPSQAQPEPLKLPGAVTTGKRTVVIMTALRDFQPSYSVAAAVTDQATALALTNPTWDIQIWVMQGANDQGLSLPTNISVKKVIPNVPFIENITSEEKSDELKVAILKELAPLGPVAIITHDLMFVSWYAVFAHALHKIGATGGHAWFHIPHSLPSSREGKTKYLTTLPAGNHHVVTVAQGYEAKFAEYYQIPVERVHRIANIRDPRSWGTMSMRVRHIVSQTRLWAHDWVQVFPICTTRLEAKGFSKVVRTFAMMNEKNPSFLLVCNPNAGGERSTKIIADAKARVVSLGLAAGKWAFTSDLLSDPQAQTYGLTADELKSLMYGYGNLMILPSMAEADSLILREAQLANQLTVGNDDVPTLRDADDVVHWGTTDKVDDATCRFVANKLLMRGIPDPFRRKVLRERNLEGIGNQWGSLLIAAGPSA